MITSTADRTQIESESRHEAKFIKVRDGRKQSIRGLWKRNDRFYAQFTVFDPIAGKHRVQRIPLMDRQGEPVGSVAQAVAVMEGLRTKRRDTGLEAQVHRAPRFGDYADRYLDAISAGTGAKKHRVVIGGAGGILKQWRKHLKDIRLEQILKVLVNDFVTKRLKAGRSPRACNLDVVILRNVIKRAINDGLLPANPIAGLKPLKVTTRKRSLASAAEIDKVIEAAFQTRTNEKGESVPVTQNARQFADYIRFLQFTGAREKEALRVKWADVDSEGGHVTIGADGDTKNHKGRTVEFNPKLASLLKEMSRRRAPDSEWLFPSPQRGEKDIRARSFRESLNLTRSAAGLPKFGFHDCRHHFISMAVMSGVDYMTIASWVGHQDGGVLIGKVYGPQANEHKKAMAVKLNFGPTVLERTGSPVPRLMKKKPTAFELAQLAAKAAPPNARPKDVVRRAWLFWVEAERELAEHERRSEYLRRLFWTPDGKNIPIFTGTPAVLEARIKECPGDYQEVSRAMWNQEFSTLVVEKELFRDRTLSQEARHKLFLGLAKAYTR